MIANGTVFEVLQERAAEDGSAHAWSFYSGRKVTDRLDRRSLLLCVEHLAGYLAAALGVEAGDRVGVLSTNRIELPALLLALMRIGAVAVPLNPAAAPEDWATVLVHAGARLLFAASDLPRPLPPLTLEVHPLEGLLERRGGPAPTRDVSGDSPALVLYTSGTTGDPKGVLLAQRSLLANAQRMAALFGLDRDVQLAVLPLYHAHALGFGLLTALVSGGHLVVADRFDPLSWAHVVREEGVRVTSVVPQLLRPLLEVGTTRAKVPTLERVLVSSAPLDASLARAFESTTGLPLVQGWGLSEYTNFACCMPPDMDSASPQELVLGGETGSMGCPLPGTSVDVVGHDGTPLGEGEIGELRLRGDGLMLGYFRDADATRKTIDDSGWLRTGDEGCFRRIGGRPFFFVTGRIKEVIIRAGEKLSPAAIERVLVRAVPELAGKVAVVGFPHRVYGEEVGAYVESGGPSEPLDRAVRAALLAMVPNARPKVVIFGAAPLPRTHTGKLQRRKLAPLFAPHALCGGPPLVTRRPC